MIASRGQRRRGHITVPTTPACSIGCRPRVVRLHRGVQPIRLSARRPREVAGFLEGATAARLYGAVNAPTSLEGWEGQLDRTLAILRPTPVIFEFLDLMATVELLPRALRPAQKLLLRAAVDLVPDELQERLGLSRWRLSRSARWMLRMVARTADRIHLLDAPPAVATRRLGLPSDYLYRTRPSLAATMPPGGSN